MKLFQSESQFKNYLLCRCLTLNKCVLKPFLEFLNLIESLAFDNLSLENLTVDNHFSDNFFQTSKMF